MEFSATELANLGEGVVDFITRYLLTLEDGPIRPAGLDPKELRARLDEPLPRQAQGLDTILQDFQEKIVDASIRVGHPRFLAWIRPSPLAVPVYAEALAASLNQSVSVWDGAPAATEVELRVIEWLKELSGFGSEGAGLLASGGSMANFICLLAARSAMDPEVRERGLAGQPPFSLYISPETHYCVVKAAEMMGLGRRFVRLVATDTEFRLDPAALAKAIRADRSMGLHPLAVVATLGTVNSGACDDLQAIGQVCRELGVWLHVDGAYGGLAAMTPEKKSLAAGIETVDSLAFDPHKSLYIPFEAGCVLVRNPAHLQQAFSVEADYLPNTEPDCPPELFHFRDYGPQLSRSFRALKLYLTFKAYGAERLSEAISFQYNLASRLAERIQADPELERLAPVPLGIVAFRYCGRPEAGAQDPGRLDRLNSWVAAESQRRGQVFLAGTRLGGTTALRACFVSYRTQEDDLDLILDEVRYLGRTYSE